MREYLDMTSTAEGYSARQNIRSAVANIDGFLMPHPGVCGDGVNFSGAVEGSEFVLPCLLYLQHLLL